MKCSTFSILLALCATAAFAQSTSTAPKPSTPSTSSAPALQPRGPEAVAKEQPNKVVATIDGKQITAQQAVDLMNSLSAQDRKRFENNLPGLLQQLYMEEQVAAAAAKENLDQKPPYKQQLQMARANILTQAYLANLAENPAAADKAKQYYDAHSGDFDQVKVSGIVVAFNPPGTPATSSATARTEPDAQAKAMDLEKKIKAGGDFSALARTDSDQQQSATKGGDMGSFVMADNIPAEIKSTLAKLQPGQVAEPVRVNGGYIILKLDSRTRLPFDKVKSGLIQKLELDKYKIHVDDPEFFAGTPQTSNIPSLARPNAPATQTTPGKPPAR
jgi:parvulin-like peptidyl-prolyl isomerase